MRRLDIGVASYGNPDGLQRLIMSVARRSSTDWRLHIILNPHPDPVEREATAQVCARAILGGAPQIVVHEQSENIGYVGAVNEILLGVAQTEYIAYLDHDVEILSDGWDETMAMTLDRFHELGMVFPNGGPYPIDRGVYTEILWGVGCCWMIPRRVVQEVGLFDQEIGHHEEVDYQTRVRLQGLKIAAVKGVGVRHEGKASNDPASQKRISDGVIRWVNKWCAYFGGKGLGYHSSNVIRHEDWPTSALYLEEYWKMRLPRLNENPEVVTVDGQQYDLIRVPRLKGFYRHRVI